MNDRNNEIEWKKFITILEVNGATVNSVTVLTLLNFCMHFIYEPRGDFDDLIPVYFDW